MVEEVLQYLHHPGVWLSFLTLSLLEIVLGIDNVIFVAIVANRLPEPARTAARSLGIILAFFMRVAFLVTIVWLVALRRTIYNFGGFELSWRDLILAGGGLFLLYKALVEISAELRGEAMQERAATAASFALVVVQIVLLDLVFSVDSIFTAVGLSQQLPVMISAIVVAILVMLLAAGPVGNFIHHHPTIKMLALAFLLLVAAALLTDSSHHHLDRAYLYIAIGFTLLIELLLLGVPQGQKAIGAPLIFIVCAGFLVGAGYYARTVHPEISWSYFYVPAVFGLVVQILNFFALSTQRRMAREALQAKKAA
ncbi:MAG: TerC family protein [Alphaproteobacteria bacterium]